MALKSQRRSAKVFATLAAVSRTRCVRRVR